jgi:hypothetical protein
LKPRHVLPLKQKFDDSDRLLYPQFRAKLEAKLRVDGRAIGGPFEQIWFGFSSLDGSAATRMLPWMEVYKDSIQFTPDEFFKQMDIAFGDPRRVDKAVGQLSRIRQGSDPFRVFLSEFDRTLLEARGWAWDDIVKKGLLRKALSRKLLDRMVSVEESETYEGYCTQLRGVSDRLEERDLLARSFARKLDTTSTHEAQPSTMD